MAAADGSTYSLSDLQNQYSGPPPAGGGAPGGGTTTSLSTNPLDLMKVYMGSNSVDTYYSADAYANSGSKSGSLTRPNGSTEYVKEHSVQQALRQFDKLSIKEQRKQLRLLAIGGFAGTMTLAQIDDFVKNSSQLVARSAYQNLLETASDYYTNAHVHVSPKDVLRSAMAYRLQGEGIKWNGNFGAFASGLGNSGVGKPHDTTTTQTSYTDLTPQNAKGLIRQTLQNEMGRDPTQGEYEDFLSSLMAAEKEDPTVTQTTTHYNGVGKATATTQHTTPGADMQEVALEHARQQPGWAEWQAMGTYAPALYSALGSAVPGA